MTLSARSTAARSPCAPRAPPRPSIAPARAIASSRNRRCRRAPWSPRPSRSPMFRARATNCPRCRPTSSRRSSATRASAPSRRPRRTRSKPRCTSCRFPNTTFRSRSSCVRASRSRSRSRSRSSIRPISCRTRPPSLEGLNAEVKAERLYFGNDLFGTTLGAIEPWAVGEEPILLMPRAPSGPNPFDAKPVAPVATQPAAPVAVQPPCRMPASRSPAKGEVTGDDQLPQSPAERLGLTGEKRAKAEKLSRQGDLFRGAASSRCAGRSRSRRW